MVKQKPSLTKFPKKVLDFILGKEVTMTLKPAPVNNGFTFVGVDLEGQPIIKQMLII